MRARESNRAAAATHAGGLRQRPAAARRAGAAATAARPVLGRMPPSTRYTRYPAAIVAAARSFSPIAAASAGGTSALRQTRRRVQLDVLARLAAEQLIERHVERLALDVPQRQVDGAERVQPLLAGRVEPVHEGGLPDHLGVERVLADDASGDVADRVRRPALPDPGDAGVGVDEHDHVALREGLRAVRVVVRRIEDRESS